MAGDYLHGYSQEEQERLIHQAKFLEDFVYRGVDYSKVKTLLEVGSGVGAQTEILLRRFPHLKITCVDISKEQIELARQRLKSFIEKGQVEIFQANAEKLDFLKNEAFDAAFLCWFLEHVPDPVKVLREVKLKIVKGGQITLTEVNNSSLFVNPYSPNILKYWYEFNDYQWSIRGHPFVGLQLGNMLDGLGYSSVGLEFRPMHFDHRDPTAKMENLEYFFNIFKSANDGLVRKGRVHHEMIDKVKEEFDLAKRDSHGVFYYSFVRATAHV